MIKRLSRSEVWVRETKPQIVNQQRVVYRFQCGLCDAGDVGYTRGHLHTRVDGHKPQVTQAHCVLVNIENIWGEV